MRSAEIGVAHRADWIVLSLLTISLLVNALLGLTVVRRTAPPAATNVRTPLGPGASAPTLELQTIDGRETRLVPGSHNKPMIIYVMSPTCSWCERNLSNIRALASAVGSSYEMLAISLLRAAPEVFAEMDLGFEVYQRPSSSTLAAYGIAGTPHTFVISRTGKVLKSWPGAYAEKTAHEIQSYFGLTLPGLSAAQIARTKPNGGSK